MNPTAPGRIAGMATSNRRRRGNRRRSWVLGLVASVVVLAGCVAEPPTRSSDEEAGPEACEVVEDLAAALAAGEGDEASRLLREVVALAPDELRPSLEVLTEQPMFVGEDDATSTTEPAAAAPDPERDREVALAWSGLERWLLEDCRVSLAMDGAAPPQPDASGAGEAASDELLDMDHVRARVAERAAAGAGSGAPGWWEARVDGIVGLADDAVTVAVSGVVEPEVAMAVCEDVAAALAGEREQVRVWVRDHEGRVLAVTTPDGSCSDSLPDRS